MFNTGNVSRFTASGVDPKLLRRVPYRLRHQAALENDPAKVLQMVEAGEGLRADELSGRDQAGQAAWGAWFDDEPRVREWKDTAAPNSEAERRYVDTLRAAFDVPPGLCEWPAYDRPSTTFPVDAPAGGQTGG
jgi:hypothetical protein